jgi:hypothetical protein
MLSSEQTAGHAGRVSGGLIQEKQLMKTRWFGIMVLLWAVSSAVGCSSDPESSSGGASLTACNAYCDAAGAAKCTDYADAAECKADECDGLGQAPAACDTAMKTYYDCLKAQPNVCDSTCTPDISKCQ